MESKEPDRFYIRESDRKHYESLLEKGTLFKNMGKENKHVFIMAMLTGFRDGSRIELDKKEGFFRTEYLTPREKSIIKAIAVAEKGDLDVLLDKKEVFSIAEEYATGGIKLLKDRVLREDYGSYVKRLESDLVKAFEGIARGVS